MKKKYSNIIKCISFLDVLMISSISGYGLFFFMRSFNIFDFSIMFQVFYSMIFTSCVADYLGVIEYKKYGDHHG